MAVTKKTKKTAAKAAPQKSVAKTVKKAVSAKKTTKSAKPVPKAKIKAKVKPAASKTSSKKSTTKPSGTKKLPAKPVAKAAKPTTAKIQKASLQKKGKAKPVAAKKIVKPVSKKEEKKVVTKPAVKKVAEKLHPQKIELKAPIKKEKATTQHHHTAVKPTTVAKPAAPKVPRSSIKTKDIKVAPAKPVTLPVLSTSKSRKYQPDFIKSVLSPAPKEKDTSPLVRYSDAELKEFKDLIVRKLDAAKKELSFLQGLITRKDDLGGDESENRYMTMEDGSLSMEREQLGQMASRQITFIDHLEKALVRIENKTYGICRVTGKLIEKARLRAVPHATLSLEAKMGIVK